MPERLIEQRPVAVVRTVLSEQRITCVHISEIPNDRDHQYQTEGGEEEGRERAHHTC